MEMTPEARAAKNEYMREYRKKNRDKCNANSRRWRRNNPEKVKACAIRYWEKKAEEAENAVNPA